MKRRAWAGIFALSLAVIASAGDVAAQPPPSDAPVQGPPPVAPAATGQGIAVVAVGNAANDDAFALARAVYGSRLRPRSLDEVRARILAGGPLPETASHELKDLAEVRAGITTEDAAGRRLLSGLAQQVGAEALLVVRTEGTPPTTDADAGAPATSAEAGAPAPGNAAASSSVVARLFLVSSGDFDAARYQPDPDPATARTPAAWKSTIVSLEARFPVGSPAAVPGPVAVTQIPFKQEGLATKGTPFYASWWFWGAVAGAAIAGVAFYFAAQDTGSDTIHVQMRLPQ